MLPTTCWRTSPASLPCNVTASWACAHRALPTASRKSCRTPRLRRGVVVSSTDAGVHVDLYVVIEYGTNINTVSRNLIEQVTFALTEYAKVPIDGIEVHVQGVKVRR